MKSHPLRGWDFFRKIHRNLAPLIYEGGGRAQRGRGEYIQLGYGLPLPLRGIPLINEGDK